MGRACTCTVQLVRSSARSSSPQCRGGGGQSIWNVRLHGLGGLGGGGGDPLCLVSLPAPLPPISGSEHPPNFTALRKTLCEAWPTPTWEGRQGAEAALVSSGTTFPLSPTENTPPSPWLATHTWDIMSRLGVVQCMPSLEVSRPSKWDRMEQGDIEFLQMDAIPVSEDLCETPL